MFFAPVELTNEKDAINRQIVDVFEKAKIAVVLLDRDLVAYPDRSKYDLVGIDNRRAGHVITAHLLRRAAAGLRSWGVPAPRRRRRVRRRIAAAHMEAGHAR